MRPPKTVMNHRTPGPKPAYPENAGQPTGHPRRGWRFWFLLAQPFWWGLMLFWAQLSRHECQTNLANPMAWASYDCDRYWAQGFVLGLVPLVILGWVYWLAKLPKVFTAIRHLAMRLTR